ncbi:histone methylation protein DOT1 domain-containing protein [Ditylenchus destructor]|nr:histone methylation protein DOT1 domain-containing protein [Ditylenchus destructor]
MSNSESLPNGHHSSNVSNSGSTTNNNRHSSPAKASDEMKTLKLQSPTGGNPLTFQYNTADVKKHLVGLDILDAIKMAMSHFSGLFILKYFDPNSYSELKSICKKFNKAAITMSQMWKDTMSVEGGSADLQQMAHKELLRALVNRSYNRAVENEKALNKHYEAFSSQTYGETSFDRMRMILDEIQPTNKDVFVDLGSGVGQLVVHVAGGSQVSKAIGIEIAQLPSKFATTLESEFKKWMSWFGKKYQHFELHRGDFLDEKFRELISQEATIIFINNYAFTSDLETRIKLELLSELRDGVRIISTKPYVPVNKNSINDRQMNDISVIIDVVEMKRCANPCSWTSADVPYYMHTINRAKLERYFFSGRARSNDGSRRSSTPSSKASNSRAPSRESSVGIREREYNCRQTNGYHHLGGAAKAHSTNGEEIGYGPTTRRKWNEYVSELHKRKKDGTAISEDGMASTSKAGSMIIYRQPPLQVNFDDQPQSSNGVNEFSFELINSPPAAETITSNDLLSLERDTTSPAKKRPKRSYEKKEKTRGRPRKSDPQGGQGHHSNHKNPRLSDEAKEGIELMHEMTKAVASGSNLDGVNPALILADLTNQRQKKALNSIREREAMDLMQTIQTSPPITDAQQSFLQIPFPALPGTSIASPSSKFEANLSKYPNLDNELKHLYENFFDTVHTPEFLQGMIDKVSAAKAKNELYINTADSPLDANLRQKMNNNLNTNLLERIQEIHAGKLASDPSNRDSTSMRFVERSRKILEHHRRIRTKCAELESEIALLNDETEQLLNEYQQKEEEDRQNRQAQQRELRFQEQQQAQQQQQMIAAQQQANALASAAATQQQVSQQLVAAAAQQLTGNGGMFGPALEQITLSDLAHYSQQIGVLNQTPLLSQIQSHLSILNNAAPYDQLSAVLQALAGAGMTLPSPQTTALHSPVVGSVQQQQMTAVQNFLSTNLGLELNALGQNASTATLNTELNALNNSAYAGTNLNIAASAIQHQQLAAAIVASEAAQPPHTPVSSISINSALVSSSTPATAQITDEAHHSSSVAAVVAAVAAGHKDAKKSTPRKSSSKVPPVSSANKSRNGPTAKNAGQVEDPVKQEEIERQIQDIVERCLEVDSAAKCAEKERKARSGDRKREKSNSVASTSADSISSNKKRSSTDSISNFIPPTTPTVSTSADFVAPSLNNFASAAAASAAALLHNANNRTVEAKSESPVFTFAPSSVSLAISAATLQPHMVGNSIESAQEARHANLNSSQSTYMTSYIPLSSKTRAEQASQQQNPVLSPISPNFSPNFPTTPTPSSSSTSLITIKQEPQSMANPQSVSALDESIMQTIKKHTAS